MPPRICAAGGHFNPLRSHLLYIGIGLNGDFQRYKLRLCRAHLDVVQKNLSEHEVSPEDGTLSGGDAALSNCLSGGEPLDERSLQVFITCYPSQNQRKDYWARYCLNHTIPDYLSKNEYAE